MTKLDIVIEISQDTGVEREEVSKTLEAFFQVVKNNLSSGEGIYIRGFGTFSVKKRAAKTGRNISKNTAVHIPEQHVPIFKPSKFFIKQVKERG